MWLTVLAILWSVQDGVQVKRGRSALRPQPGIFHDSYYLYMTSQVKVLRMLCKRRRQICILISGLRTWMGCLRPPCIPIWRTCISVLSGTWGWLQARILWYPQRWVASIPLCSRKPAPSPYSTRSSSLSPWLRGSAMRPLVRSDYTWAVMRPIERFPVCTARRRKLYHRWKRGWRLFYSVRGSDTPTGLWCRIIVSLRSIAPSWALLVSWIYSRRLKASLSAQVGKSPRILSRSVGLWLLRCAAGSF